MIEIKRIFSNHELYPFMEELMKTAFPLQERRDLDKQRFLTDHQPLFHNNVLLAEGEAIGLLTDWTLSDFIYIEHFAIHPQFRSHGYGSQALEALQKELKGTPLILEVEEPTDEWSIRRIAFYQRQGFTLHEQLYLQPPYRTGDDWLPFKLMSTEGLDVEGRFTEIRDCIYREVYHVESPAFT